MMSVHQANILSKLGFIVATSISAWENAMADDLEVIANRQSPAIAIGQAYERLTGSKFDRFLAEKLSDLIWIYGSRTSGARSTSKQPWLESQLSEFDKIACTLEQVWRHHVDKGSRQEVYELLMELIETAQTNTADRALNEIASWLNAERALMPPIKATLSRLDRVARDSSKSSQLRINILGVLSQHGDPNKYLHDVTHLASEGLSPEMRAQIFVSGTQAPHRLSTVNKGVFFRYSFELLKGVEKERPGKGHGLATHIGICAGVPPARAGQRPFEPDKELMEQNGADTRTAIFQVLTAQNALRWWQEHQHEY